MRLSEQNCVWRVARLGSGRFVGVET